MDKVKTMAQNLIDREEHLKDKWREKPEDFKRKLYHARLVVAQQAAYDALMRGNAS